MDFNFIANRYPKEKYYSARTVALDLLLRVVAPEVAGSLYDIPGHKPLRPFHQEQVNNKYVPLHERRPNIPEGSNTLRNQIMRQAAMVWGESRQPSIETKNEKARALLQRWVKRSQLFDKMRQSVILGSIGSVAYHVRILASVGVSNPGEVYVDVYDTRYLTPKFSKSRPNEVVGMVEKYVTTGYALAEMGFTIAEEYLSSKHWFMREWNQDSEIWYVPWRPTEEEEAKKSSKTFVPKVDEVVPNNVGGKCLWLWRPNLPLGGGIDGTCQFSQAIDHAINLDYLESQIGAAVKYTMAPILVVSAPPEVEGLPNSQIEGSNQQGWAKSSSRILTIDLDGKATYLEISGDGIEAARKVADTQRKSIIEGCHGDRVDPSEVTQAHQGAKSIEMLNQPLLGLCEGLRDCYGDSFLQLLRLFIEIITIRGAKGYLTEIWGEIITPDQAKALGDVLDLDISWGPFYPYTPAEKLADAQSRESDFRNGFVSQETIVTSISSSYRIAETSEEIAKIDADQKKQDDRAIRLASATVQVKATDSID